MAVLERISVSRDAFLCNALTLCVLNTGDIVCTYISTDARNALWFMAVRHISYTMPHGENKEYKACSRWIFLNLQRNRNSWIINHLHKATVVLARGTNVYNKCNISNFLQKEGPMGSETCPKRSGERCYLTFRAKKSSLRQNLKAPGPPGTSREYFLDSNTHREHFEYLRVQDGL